MESKTKEIVGNLLLTADELSQRVITSFDPFASRAAINVKALKRFNLDLLEPCAEFLKIKLDDDDGNKLFTKETLVSRILLALNALLPATCSECSEKYTVELEPEKEPCFYCHMCFQGCHNCDETVALHLALSDMQKTRLAGSVWLCHECLATSSPVKPRKSKSRHDRDGLDNERLEPINEDQDNMDDGDGDVVEISSVTCPEYRKGKCPHGMRGTKVLDGKRCTFTHPKRCTKYCRNGSRGKNGCKKGAECNFDHPTLCRNSVKKRLCTNQQCTYVHLAGTARKEGISKKKTMHPHGKENNGNKRSRYQTSARRTDQSTKPQGDSFLELKSLVESIHTSFQAEISMLKASLIQQRIPMYTTPPWMNQSQFPLLSQPTPLIPPGGRVTLPSSC